MQEIKHINLNEDCIISRQSPKKRGKRKLVMQTLIYHVEYNNISYATTLEPCRILSFRNSFVML